MKIRTIKLKKSEYANMPALLKRAGLVQGSQAYPGNITVSKKTYRLIRIAVGKAFKKQYPYASSQRLKASVGMELLNLAPNVVDNGIETGYAVVVPLK